MSNTTLAAPPPVVEVVLSFDTTGSMFKYLDTLRAELGELLEGLFSEIPNLRLGLIAHGDYCDADSSYIIKYLPLIQDRRKLLAFVEEVGPTFGGDAPECYELALNKASKEMHWSDDATTRCLVMIGDDEPHKKGYKYGGHTVQIDWRNQLKALAAKDVMIYAVQCGSNQRAEAFWKELASGTSGQYLQMNQVNTLKDAILALCFRQANNQQALERHEEWLVRSGQMTVETRVVIECIKVTRVHSVRRYVKRVSGNKATGAPKGARKN
jgi:hypothetical protein